MTVFVTNPLTIDIKPAKAWSGDTHGWLSKTAIRMMPSPWDTRLNTKLDYFLEHSREPDSIRSALEDTDRVGYDMEAPRHYVDADVRPEIYGNATYHPQPPFNRTYYPRDPRKSSDYQLGVTPWAVENWTKQLTEDLKVYNWDDETILMDMCMLAHYVQDSWMPFHAVSFYDGQRVPATGEPDAGMYYQGGQDGIHGEVENYMLQQRDPEAIQAILDSVTGEAKYVNPYMASLRGILSGETVARQLLDVKDVHGYTYMSADWRQFIWDNLCGPDGNYTKRLINSSIETANVWYTAFVDAGVIQVETTTTTPPTTNTTTVTTTTTTTQATDFTAFELITLVSLAALSTTTILRRRKLK